MKEWVRKKLDRIHELYPEKRLKESKARWQALWSGQQPADRYPFVFAPLSFSYYDDNFAKEEGLRHYLDEWIWRGFVEDDFIPAFFPGCRQGAIPGMFGAKEIQLGRDHTNEKLLFAPEDIEKMPDADVQVGVSTRLYLEMERYFLEECEGEIPVHVCDMQGPIDAAAQLFGYDKLFLLACDDQARYAQLMDKMVDAFCQLWDTQKEVLGTNFIPTHLYGWDWVPPGNGATLSADSMVMVSGDFFKSYYQPYLEQIANRLGSLTVHSCGDFSEVVPALGALSCVQAVNASQMSVEELLEVGWPCNKTIVLQEPLSRVETVFSLIKRKQLRVSPTFTGLWPADVAGNNIPPAFWTKMQKAMIREGVAWVQETAKI